jgi:putative ABC transport system substrate-binding protein
MSQALSQTIGYLTSSDLSSPVAADGFQQFRQRLEELGYRDGQNVTIAHRSTETSNRGFPDLAAELQSLPVDILVVGDSRAIPIVKNATNTIPIVMTVSGDVVGQGLVASLAQPGGNLTGLTDSDPFRPLDLERLDLILQTVKKAESGASRVAVLWNGGHPGVALAYQDLEAAAPALSVDLVSLEVQDPGDLDAAFQEAVGQKVNALLVLPDPLTNLNAQQIVDLAAQHGLPAMYGTRLFVDAGGLMHYGPNRAAMFRRAADYVDRILKDPEPASVPATLPIELPARFEFVISERTANVLKLSIPPSILQQATEIIR